LAMLALLVKVEFKDVLSPGHLFREKRDPI